MRYKATRIRVVEDKSFLWPNSPLARERIMGTEIIPDHPSLICQILRVGALIFLLGIISGSALADWRQVDRNESQGITLSVDLSATIKTGNIVILKELMNSDSLRKSGKNAYRSTIITSEYDCKNKLRRFVRLAYYFNKDGSGKLIHIDPKIDSWQPIPMGSPAESLWRLACVPDNAATKFHEALASTLSGGNASAPVSNVAPSPPPGKKPQGNSSTHLTSKEFDQHPVFLDRKDPVYPQDAQRLGKSGKVIVEVFISEAGDIVQATIVSATPPGMGFEQAVLDHLRYARFKPAYRAGIPVKSRVKYAVEFSLEDQENK